MKKNIQSHVMDWAVIIQSISIYGLLKLTDLCQLWPQIPHTKDYIERWEVYVSGECDYMWWEKLACDLGFNGQCTTKPTTN